MGNAFSPKVRKHDLDEALIVAVTELPRPSVNYVARLLQRGANPHQIVIGNLLLHYAGGRARHMELLIRYDRQFNKREFVSSGRLPLHYAALVNDLVLVKLCLEPDIVNFRCGGDKATPLQLVCAGASPDPRIVQLLIDNGAFANPDEPTFMVSALHLACCWNADPVPVVSVLLRAGADVFDRDHRCDDVMQIAKWHDYATVTLLDRWSGRCSDHTETDTTFIM